MSTLEQPQTSSQGAGGRLNQLCDAFLLSGSDDLVDAKLSQFLREGDLTQARVLLDAAELRKGTWFAPPHNAQPRTIILSVCHALLLLSEDDLDAARFFFKRAGPALPQQLVGCKQMYERLWAGDGVGALELGAQALKSGAFAELPLARTALEQVCARMRTRQLHQMQRAYSAVSVATFARAMGFSTPAEVEAFCKWSPNLFELRDGFVLPCAPQGQSMQDVSGHIEKLTRLVVFLESEAVTHVNARSKANTSGSSLQSQ